MSTASAQQVDGRYKSSFNGAQLKLAATTSTTASTTTALAEAGASCGLVREWPVDFCDRENYCLTQRARRLENPRSAQVPSKSTIAPYSSPAMRPKNSDE
jgi:hypothetical protein